MSETALQRYLRGGGTPDTLEAAIRIKAKRHGRYRNLVLFKYNQIDSPFAERIVQESRGIILDEAGDWRVVCRAFDKFFNVGEVHAATSNWATAEAQEKLDGSLCTLYWYDGDWHVATTGSPDAAGDVNGMSLTFAELFWRTWKDCGFALPYDNTRLCYAFELTSPYNRIVVKHAKPGLTLLGVRNRETGEELRPTEGFPYPVAPRYSLRSVDEALATFEHLEPLEHEGYVICDAAFNRVKVKHPGYVAIHHLKDGMCPRRILEIIRAGETTELLAHFPEWTAEFAEVETRYLRFVAEIEVDYESLKAIPVQKDFALKAVKTRCSAALFMLRAGKVTSVREHLAKVHIKHVMDFLGLRDDPPVAEAA